MRLIDALFEASRRAAISRVRHGRGLEADEASGRKEIQTFPEGNPRLFGRESKFFGRKSKLNASVSFAGSSLIKALRRPPGAPFCCTPLPASKEDMGWRRRCLFACICRFPGLHRVPMVFSSEVKGWRRFKIADGRASFVRLGGRAADEREREPGVHGECPGTSRKRQADRSDVRQEIRPQKARTGFEPL
jgi:hypothetical protein